MAMEIEPILHNEQWAPKKKFFSLFIITYLLLYIFPFPFEETPVIGPVVDYYYQGVDFLSFWIGSHIFQIKNLDHLRSYGGETIEFVMVFTLFLSALAITTLVFFIDKKRTNYKKLYYLVIGYARFYVGIKLLSYGFYKVSGGQFIFPPLKLFETPFGNFSSQQLLWAFMGYSKLYGTFIAVSEIMGGLLLLFPRTKLVGCILVIIIMSNVLLLDIVFINAIIVFSGHLLLIAIIIIYPYLKRIIDFLIFKKADNLENVVYIFQSKKLILSKNIFKSVIILCFLYLVIYPGVSRILAKPIYTPLYGVYRVKKFTIGQDSSITAADSIRWQRLIIDKRSSFITTISDSTSIYKTAVDTIKKTLNIVSVKDTSTKYQFTYSEIADSTLVIRGNWKGKDVIVTAKKKNPQEYFLINRKPKDVSVVF